MKKQETVVIFTDGSCLWNPGPGWWAAFLMYKNKEKVISWWKKHTTNNQMELTAIIKALELLKKTNIILDIYTDSNYVKNGMKKWIVNWKKNKRRTATKKSVKNKELWQELDKLASIFQINWHWVKAHSTNKHNNLVDKLARKEATKIQKNKIN